MTMWTDYNTTLHDLKQLSLKIDRLQTVMSSLKMLKGDVHRNNLLKKYDGNESYVNRILWGDIKPLQDEYESLATDINGIISEIASLPKIPSLSDYYDTIIPQITKPK